MISSAHTSVRAASVVVLLSALAYAGCASIVSGRHAEVTIDSVPSNAHVVVRDKRGHEVANAVTPATVALKRKDRWIFPARYTATIEAQGYESETVPIHSTLNPWVLGNVMVGGVVGIVVDSATGAAWKPKTSEIRQQLSPIYPMQQAASSAMQPNESTNLPTNGPKNGPLIFPTAQVPAEAVRQ